MYSNNSRENLQVENRLSDDYGLCLCGPSRHIRGYSVVLLRVISGQGILTIPTSELKAIRTGSINAKVCEAVLQLFLKEFPV